MKFDISDIDKKEVKKATLELKWCFSPILKCVGNYGTKSGEHEYSIYDVEKEWSAESLSWDGFSKAGAIGVDSDEEDPISTTTLEKPKDKETVSFDVTALAKKWAKDSKSNRGLIISAPNTIGNYFAVDDDDVDPSSDQVVAYFYSNEADDELRPKLIVEYDDSPVLHAKIQQSSIAVVGMKSAIKIEAPEKGEFSVTVSNLQGQRVASEVVTQSSVTINDNIRSGIYLVSIEQDGFVRTQRVIVK